MLKSHTFTIRIDGVAYNLVTGVSFSRSMDMLGGAFSITLIDPDVSLVKAFRPGVTSSIEIDGKLVAKGVFDEMSIDDSKGHVYSYLGRDPSGDLVKSSAMFSDKSFSRKNIRLETAIKELLTPFKMGVKIAVKDTGKAFAEIAITPGETVAEVLRRICKYRAVFPFSDGVENIIITKAGGERSAGHITVGDDGNVETRSGRVSHVQRHSEIIVKGGSNGDSDAWSETPADDLSGKEGRAFDPDVKRYSPLIIQAESEGYDLDMKERALWEVRHRRFSGTELTYNLAGWEAAEGSFWKINTLVSVKDAPLFINRDMLIKAIELVRDDNGTRTNITVSPAESYDLPPSREPDSDDALFGGAA